MRNYKLKLQLALLFIIFYRFLYSQYEFENTDSIINYLEGEWEWISSCGGMVPHCMYPADLGYSQTLIFKRIEDVNDSIEYEFYRNDTLIDNYGANIIYGESLPLGMAWNLANLLGGISIEAESYERVFFHDNAYDGFKHTYDKKIDNTIKNKLSSAEFLKIYPNPCTNFIEISTDNFQIIESLIICNNNGSLTKIIENIKTNSLINISDIPNGFYLTKILTKDFIYYGKIIKQ